MTLEILKKLVALANNNPNDNEANLAARKVCKALIEDKFIERLTEIPQTTTTRPNNPNSYNPVDDIFADMFRYASQAQENFYRDPPFDPFRTRSRRETRKNVRKLRCKECKQEFNTTFVGAAELFVCNECTWSAWTKKEEKTKEQPRKRSCDKCATPITCVGFGYCNLSGKTI